MPTDSLHPRMLTLAILAMPPELPDGSGASSGMSISSTTTARSWNSSTLKVARPCLHTQRKRAHSTASRDSSSFSAPGRMGADQLPPDSACCGCSQLLGCDQTPCTWRCPLPPPRCSCSTNTQTPTSHAAPRPPFLSPLCCRVAQLLLLLLTCYPSRHGPPAPGSPLLLCSWPRHHPG